MKIGELPSNYKYTLMIDSEEYREGKMKRTIKKWSEKDLEVIWVKQSEKNDVPFANESTSYRSLKVEKQTELEKIKRL